MAFFALWLACADLVSGQMLELGVNIKPVCTVRIVPMVRQAAEAYLNLFEIQMLPAGGRDFLSPNETAVIPAAYQLTGDFAPPSAPMSSGNWPLMFPASNCFDHDLTTLCVSIQNGVLILTIPQCSLAALRFWNRPNLPLCPRCGDRIGFFALEFLDEGGRMIGPRMPFTGREGVLRIDVWHPDLH